MSNLRNHLGNIWQKVRDSGVLTHMGTAAKNIMASSGNPYGAAGLLQWVPLVLDALVIEL
jgi:hypothetical protein